MYWRKIAAEFVINIVINVSYILSPFYNCKLRHKISQFNQPEKASVESSCYGFGNTCFTNPWGPRQAHNFTLGASYSLPTFTKLHYLKKQGWQPLNVAKLKKPSIDKQTIELYSSFHKKKYVLWIIKNTKTGQYDKKYFEVWHTDQNTK